MNSAREGELVTPRARSLTLEGADDPEVRYRVERGDALRFVGWRPDGLVEVDYLQRRWVTSGEALQLLAQLSGGEVPTQPAELPPPPPVAMPPDEDDLSLQPVELAATGADAAAPSPQVGAGWRLVLMGAALVLVVALALLLVRWLRVDEESLPSERAAPVALDGGTATAAAAPVVPVVPRATAVATPQVTVTPPVVSNMVVCDTSVDCGIAEGEFSRSEFLACLQVMPGGGGGALVLVATSGEAPPAGPQGATVLARSGPVPQDPAFRCHSVRSTGGELATGRYWLWALDGMTALGRVPFVVGQP